eukprot:6178306-Pleurochrysis_carterae.AAC.9
MYSFVIAYAALPNSFALRTPGRAAEAGVALCRLASGPDSQNAAQIRRIGGGMPSETLGRPVLSFYMLVITRATLVKTADMCCPARRSAKAHAGQGSNHQRAGEQ